MAIFRPFEEFHFRSTFTTSDEIHLDDWVDPGNYQLLRMTHLSEDLRECSWTAIPAVQALSIACDNCDGEGFLARGTG